MNQINGSPNNSDFGLNFDYAVWTANTNITLTNVPWNNDYRDVVAFPTTTALNQYIDKSLSQNVNIANSMYAKANEPILIEMPFNQANRFNYVRVYNPAQPLQRGDDQARYFYYFITDVQYAAPNTTRIIVQLDVFQTYIRQVTFGRCYIERGHLGIANKNAFRNYGRDYLSVPEGLDVGDSYQIIRRQRRQVINRAGKDATANGPINNAEVGASILVVSTVDLSADPGTVQNPKLKAARGTWSAGLASGAEMYLFKTETDFVNFMANYSQYPWVTQGIVSITYIPHYKRYYTDDYLGARLKFGGYKFPQARPTQRVFSIYIPKTGDPADFRYDPRITNWIPPRYRHLDKFRTFPYLAIRVASNNGQQVILQPERWNSTDGDMREFAAINPPNARVSIFPRSYDSSVNSDDFVNNQGQAYVGADLDYAVSISNFPTLPLVNNNAVLYMAQNAHSMAFGYQSADWSQQKALRSNEVSYDQATMGIAASAEQTRVNNSADVSNTGISNNLAQDTWALNAVSGILGGMVGGGSLGGKAGLAGAAIGGASGVGAAITSGISTGMQVDAANAHLATRTMTANMSNDIASGLAGRVRDTNKSLSDWAARGDYENAIAGMNAKTRDAQLNPPSLVGQSGGEIFNLVNGTQDFRVEILMPSQSIINAIGEYWLRYGYAIQRFGFIPSSLMVMTKFTYWKMKETYIRAAGMPETFKQAIRGIFEKGVTVWANPDDIGVIDPADNMPLPDITIDGYVPVPIPPDEIEPPVVTPKRKNKKMLVYSTVSTDPSSPGSLWALAGSSPGTDANWIETQDSARASAFMSACQQDDPVGLTELEFAEFRDNYRSPVGTQEIPAAPEGV